MLGLYVGKLDCSFPFLSVLEISFFLHKNCHTESDDQSICTLPLAVVST